MNFETVITVGGIWSDLLQDIIDVDIYYTVDVQDASFDHDWQGGGTENRVECDITNRYVGFQWKGKAVLFDSDGPYHCLVDIDEEVAFEITDEQAMDEAARAFKHPEDYI